MTFTQFDYMAHRACFVASVAVKRTGDDAPEVAKAWADAWAEEFSKLKQENGESK